MSGDFRQSGGGKERRKRRIPAGDAPAKPRVNVRTAKGNREKEKKGSANKAGDAPARPVAGGNARPAKTNGRRWLHWLGSSEKEKRREKEASAKEEEAALNEPEEKKFIFF